MKKLSASLATLLMILIAMPATAAEGSHKKNIGANKAMVNKHPIKKEHAKKSTGEGSKKVGDFVTL